MQGSLTLPKTIIVCASMHHGNTRRVAEIFADTLDADILPVLDPRSKGLEEWELVGLGSGIYYGRHHVSLLRLVDSWVEVPRKVFLFSTAGLPCLRYWQHAALRRRVLRRGCKIVGEFCCAGWDSFGPLWLMGGLNRKRPNESDLLKARRFASGLGQDDCRIL